MHTHVLPSNRRNWSTLQELQVFSVVPVHVPEALIKNNIRLLTMYNDRLINYI